MMMRAALLLLAAAARLQVGAADEDVLVQVMSFNIRTSYASADAASTCSNWDGIRKENVISNINTIGADFVGTQETSDDQKTYLDAQLAGTYSVIGESTGSLDGAASEWDALYYRSDTWTLLTNGMFWLGPDPDTASAAWGMTYYRTCVWGRFQHISTGATICVMNTHYETPGNDEAQENGSNIILERMDTYCEDSDNLIVLMGDFNALKSYSAMQLLLANDLADPSDDPTFCGDMLSATCTVKYDFTLYRTHSDEACYLESDVSRIDYDGCYSSDHAGLVGSFCLAGSCCSDNSSSTSGSSDSVGSSSSTDQTQASVADESDVLGTVQAGDTTTESTDVTKDSSSGSGSAQEISTSSGGGSSASTTVGIIIGVLAACAIVALVVVRRKKMLENKAHLDKSAYEPDAFFVGDRDSSMSALSPRHTGSGERVSSSPIPTLAAQPRDSRDTRSSSVSVTDSERNRHENSNRGQSEVSSRSSHSMSRRSSTAVLMAAPSSEISSQYSMSVGNSMMESENGFSDSIASGYSDMYSSSMAESKVNFSEIFAPDSMESNDSKLH